MTMPAGQQSLLFDRWGEGRAVLRVIGRDGSNSSTCPLTLIPLVSLYSDSDSMG